MAVEAPHDFRAALDEMHAENETIWAQYRAVHDRRAVLAQQTFMYLLQNGSFASDADCAEPLTELAELDEHAEGVFERVQLHTRLLEVHQLILNAVAQVESIQSSLNRTAAAQDEDKQQEDKQPDIETQ